MKNRNMSLRNAPDYVFAPNVGKTVVKTSGKPFKSGNKLNTVKGITINPQTNLPAYTFYEDDSNVECYRCELSQFSPGG